jgi:transposase-like protein
MKEQQRHIDAYRTYFVARSEGMSVTDAVSLVSSEYSVSDTSVYRWMKEFDWKGREAIDTHDVQIRVAEKTNSALADNKAWYLRNIHEAVKDAESRKTVKIENMTDYEKAIKLALLIQGDEQHDNNEIKGILEGLLSVIGQNSDGIRTRGVKSSFNDKGE